MQRRLIFSENIHIFGEIKQHFFFVRLCRLLVGVIYVKRIVNRTDDGFSTCLQVYVAYTHQCLLIKYPFMFDFDGTVAQSAHSVHNELQPNQSHHTAAAGALEQSRRE